ncbi:MAG TPA: hypothetical protein VM870_06225, partial [Pyrinomonadaceae bacterium]|nr:hypothetical protein [Pyrinomonadaceae bacterium]
INFIVLLVFVGLVCFLIGRLSGRRRADGGQMIEAHAPRTLDSALAAHNATLDADTLAEIKRLLGEQQLINAIKIYRQRTNCGLREAKDAVEAIAKTL